MALMPPDDLCVSEPDTVFVKSGETLTLTTQQFPGCLRVENGGTVVSDPGFDVSLATLCLEPGGTLKLGDGRLTIIDRKPDDVDQFETGLILMGRVEIAGTPKATWGWLASEPQAGDVSLTLAFDPTGWHVGDRILLPDTRDRWRNFETATPEVRVITAIVGRAVKFDAALTIEHPGYRNSAKQIEGFPMVANLTRGLVIRSANPQGTRGHGMIAGKSTGFVRFADFQDFGRTTNDPLDPVTNHIARYALHLHMVETPGFELTGNVVQRYTRWGIDDHNSDGALITENVCFDGWGAGFLTETGAEKDSVFERNLSVLVNGTLSRGDERAGQNEFAVNGSGFWINGPGCHWRNNVSVNAGWYGFTYWGGTANSPVVETTLKEFIGNQAWSSMIGLSPWYSSATFDGFKDIHTLYGNEGYPVLAGGTLVYRNWISRSDPRLSIAQGSRGIQFGDYNTPKCQVLGADIQGREGGLQVPYGYAGGFFDTPVNFLLADSHFDNCTDAIFDSTAAGSYPPDWQLPNVYTVRNCTYGPLVKNAIRKYFRTGSNASLTALHRILVQSHDGVAGDDFEVFASEQAPDFVIPIDGYSKGAAGLTNTEAWSQLGVAIFGAVAPATTTREGIAGFVAPIADVPIPTPPPPPAPAPLVVAVPSNLTAISADGKPVAVSFALPSVSGGTAPVTVSCAPASGSLFSVGATVVTCTATDADGQTASATFTVTVTYAAPPPPPPTTVTVNCVVESVGTYSDKDAKLTVRADTNGKIAIPKGFKFMIEVPTK